MKEKMENSEHKGAGNKTGSFASCFAQSVEIGALIGVIVLLVIAITEVDSRQKLFVRLNKEIDDTRREYVEFSFGREMDELSCQKEFYLTEKIRVLEDILSETQSLIEGGAESTRYNIDDLRYKFDNMQELITAAIEVSILETQPNSAIKRKKELISSHEQNRNALQIPIDDLSFKQQQLEQNLTSLKDKREDLSNERDGKGVRS